MCNAGRMKRLAVILAVMAGSAGAQDLESGNLLAARCDDLAADQVTVQAGYCIGYLNGVWEGMKLGAALPFMIEGKKSTAEIDDISNRLLRVCLPNEVEIGQLFDIFVRYLAEHPENRHFPARLLVQLAYSEAFPCK